MFLKKYAWVILYSILLTVFTAYVLLDTFVIARVYNANPGENGRVIIDQDQFARQTDPAEETPESVITYSSYEDGRISITLNRYREYDSDIYVADIRLASADLLKTAFAQSAYGKNITAKTSETAQENNAILAINGDYYGVQERGYVLKNGVLYRSTVSKDQEDLVIGADGSFSVIVEGEISAEELMENGAQRILSFGPALVIDSQSTQCRLHTAIARPHHDQPLPCDRKT